MECSHFTSDNFKPSLVQQALENYNTVLESGYCSKCKIETDYVCDEYVYAGALESDLDKLRAIVTDLIAGIDPREIDLKPHQKIEHITGLENLGNTCYLNCVPLISPILPRKKLLDDANKSSLWTSFCSILSKMWDTGEKHISPEPFITNLRQLLPMFKGYQQQDAQELMREMLDLIHTELESRKGKTMIMQMFQGKFLNHEPCTIQQCLELFTAVEELDESEKYMCTPCNKLQSATKQMILCHLPPRFRFMDATRSKISRHVEFPLNNLDMKRYHAPTTASQLEAHPLIYSLYGVIVHIGSSGHGHYIAYILKDHKWYEMNDRKCKVVDVDQVLKQNAYMLFYEVQRNNKRARSLDSNTRPLKAHKSQ
ncbi:Ubiquitin carboxyl-terminal hydrolase 3 [Globomyces sp. JEL0801]|nr:Ubiquitin carboxyl-terminal hydrolase 3 [Globomyces sp. JEL0801]